MSVATPRPDPTPVLLFEDRAALAVPFYPATQATAPVTAFARFGSARTGRRVGAPATLWQRPQQGPKRAAKAETRACHSHSGSH